MHQRPLAIYQDLIDGGDYKADTAQRLAVEQLERVWLELNTDPDPGWWARLTAKQNQPTKGLYLSHLLVEVSMLDVN